MGCKTDKVLGETPLFEEKKTNMRNRDFFIPSVTALVLFGFIWFLSCAHQNRWKDEADGSMDEFAENQPAPETQDASSAPSDDWDSAPAPSEEKTGEDFAAAEASPTESSDDIGNSEPANETDLENPGDVDTLKKAEAEVQENAQPKTEPSVIFPSAGDTSSEAPAVEESAVTEEVIPAKPRNAWVGQTPKIPRNAVYRAGKKLNRFYFVRKGDTPKKVARLIYGKPQEWKKLTRWNGTPWNPGKLIYYSSPLNPKDTKMGSFYQERKITPEEYRIQSGDWLTRIANKRLGSAWSWKEIAVVNGLKAPNAIEVGQLLAIYPKDLAASKPEAPAEMGQLAENRREEPSEGASAPQPSVPPEEPKMPEAAPQQPVIPPPQAFAPQEADKAQVPPTIPPVGGTEEAPAVGSDSGEAMNWDQIIEQNMVAILIAAALVILLLALSARKKKARIKGSSGSSENDDAAEENSSKFGRR